MKKSILSAAALATFLILTGTARADRLGGDWAFEFQVRPTFLGYHDPGVGIAAMRHVTHRSAVRAGFTVWTTSAGMDETDRDAHFSVYDSLSATVSTVESDEGRDVTMFAHFVRDLGIGNRIAVFLEAGPAARRRVSAGSRTEMYTQGTDHAIRTIYQDYRAWDYGGEAQGGFEWFVRNRLSVAARYGVSAMRTTSSDTFEYVTTYPNSLDIHTQTGKSHAFTWSTTAATFSVIAYW
jgi:hypothetical protein